MLILEVLFGFWLNLRVAVWMWPGILSLMQMQARVRNVNLHLQLLPTIALSFNPTAAGEILTCHGGTGNFTRSDACGVYAGISGCQPLRAGIEGEWDPDSGGCCRGNSGCAEPDSIRLTCQADVIALLDLFTDPAFNRSSFMPPPPCVCVPAEPMQDGIE